MTLHVTTETIQTAATSAWCPTGLKRVAANSAEGNKRTSDFLHHHRCSWFYFWNSFQLKRAQQVLHLVITFVRLMSTGVPLCPGHMFHVRSRGPPRFCPRRTTLGTHGSVLSHFSRHVRNKAEWVKVQQQQVHDPAFKCCSCVRVEPLNWSHSGYSRASAPKQVDCMCRTAMPSWMKMCAFSQLHTCD